MILSKLVFVENLLASQVISGIFILSEGWEIIERMLIFLNIWPTTQQGVAPRSWLNPKLNNIWL